MLLSLRWWCKEARASVLVTLAVCVFFAFAAASGAVGASDGVTLDVKDAPLATVVLMLTQQSAINFVITDPEINAKRITAHLSDKPLDTVLDYILKPAGIRYRKAEDGTYFVGESSTDVATAIELPVGTQAPVQQTTAPAPKVRRVRTESVKVHNSSPSELLRALGWNGSEPIEGAAVTTGAGLDVDKQFPWKPTSPDGNIRSYAPAGGGAVQNADPVPPMRDSDGTLKSGEAGRTANTSDGADQWSPGSSSRPSYGGPGGSPYGGPGGTGGRPGGPNQPQGSSGSSNSLLPEGIDFVMPYDIDNSIIVRGDDEGIAEFKDLVHILDIPPKQVRIEARFVEVSTDDVSRLGIDWSIESLNATFNTQFRPAGNVLLGVQTGNISAQLAAELTQTKGRIVNSPIISTLNNTPATISIGKTVPFFSSVTQSVGNGQLVTTQQLVELPVQTYLFVLPRVNGDGSITLYLEPSIQDTGAVYTSPDGTEFPERSFQTVRTNRRIMNGDTIVIGGFIRQKETDSTSKVPILGDLPFFRNFFRSKSKRTEDRELLIFLTPTIISDSSTGSVGVSP